MALDIAAVNAPRDRTGVAAGPAARATREVLSGWGRYPVTEALVSRPDSLSSIRFPPAGPLVCRGEGRSYGDAALSSDGLVLLTSGLRRLCRFDTARGVLTVEAGMTIEEVLQQAVPHGWFPPVTPGTKHVSLGGAVAADVHGKNHHHAGSIGDHVLGLELILADGSRVECSAQSNSELFWATVGGLGLTGMIAKVTLQLIPIETSYVAAQHFKAPDLQCALQWLADSDHDDQYTVAWIDCLGRGRNFGRSIVMRGHHARRDETPTPALTAASRAQWQIPFDFPSFVVNPVSVGAFNQLYYLAEGRKTRPFLVHYEGFFYPLDVVGDWNRLYGRRGFLQYQFMLPEPDAADGVRIILERIVRSRRAIFLAVLKRFGPGNPAPLSFPDRGYTLAMDLPMTGADVLRLLDELDDVVVAFGGRVYLAKDARMAPHRLAPMYPRLDEWLRCKHAVDPDGRFSSDLSRRLGLTAVRSRHLASA